MATQNSLNTSLSGQTGTGTFVGSTSATLVTPTLGVAAATTINKVALTAPATGSTLTIADGKTLTQSNTLTYTGTDGSTVNFGAGGTVLYAGGPGSITWGSTASTSISMAVNTGYICTAGTTVTATLPATAAVGDMLGISATGAGAFALTANTGQTIKFLGQTTSSAGSFTSAEQYDIMVVICIVANTTWQVMYAPGSGYTVA